MNSDLMWAILAVGAVVAIIATAVLRANRREFVIYEYQRGLLFKDGKLVSLLDSGKTVAWGKSLTSQTVDVRPVTSVIGNQEILTKDGLTIKVTATARYRIVDPAKAILGSQTYLLEAYQAVQIALRDAITDLTADEVLDQRRDVAEQVTKSSIEKFGRVGLALEEVELRDITFPGELRKAMAQVALARKEGLASLERARAENAALRSLANAARMLDGNPSLMQLRLLQSLSEAKGSTIVLNTSDKPVLPVSV